MAEFRFDINATDNAGATIDALTARIKSLQASIDGLGKSQYAGVPGISDKLTADLKNAQVELSKLEGQLVNTFSGIEGFSTRAIAAMRGIPEAVQPATRALNETDRIMRAGAQNLHRTSMTVKEAILGFTSIPAAKWSTKEIEEAFGGRVVRSLKATSEEATHLEGIFGRVGKAGVSLADEFSRGQRGAMFSSISSMLRDTGVLNAAIRGLATPWGAFAIAGVAALTAVGYELEQTYKRVSSLRDTANELALTGFGGGAQTGVASAAEFDQLKAATNDWAGNIKALQEELNKLPPAAQSSRTELAQIAVAVGQLKHEDPAKVLEELVKAAQHGPVALAELITKLYGLQGQLTASGQTLVEWAKSMNNVEEAIRGVAKTGANMPITDIGRASAEAGHNAWTFAFALMGLGEAVMSDNVVAQEYTDAIKKSIAPVQDLTLETYNLTGAMAAENSAISSGNETLTKRTNLLREFLSAQSGAARLAEGRGDRPNEGTTQRRSPGSWLADAADTAEATKAAELASSKLSAGEEEAHRRREAIIRAEGDAGKEVAAVRIATAEKERDELVRVESEKTKGSGIDVTQLAIVKAADEKILEERRRAAKEEIQTDVQKQRDILASVQRGTQEKLDAGKRIEELGGARYSPELGGQPMFAPPQQAEMGRERARAEQQINADHIQSVRATLRAEVIEAEGSADKIVAAYRKAFAEINALGAKPAVTTQLQEEEVRDLRSAQAKKFTAVMEFNSSQERLGQLQIGAEKARLQALVSTHMISKAQMAAAEERFTETVFAQEEAKTQALLQTPNLTDAQYQKLYEHLAELYTKDAELQAQAQAKITADIEAENEKRKKTFTELFDKIGSSLESSISGLLTGQTTWAKAIQNVKNSIISGIVSTISSVASEYAGKKLGPSLGLTEEESKGGLGGVLGTALFKSLGMEKEVPQDAMKGAADKWTKAVSAQENATKLAGNAATDLSKSAAALQDAASSLKSGTVTGKDTQSSDDLKATTSENNDVTKANTDTVKSLTEAASKQGGPDFCPWDPNQNNAGAGTSNASTPDMGLSATASSSKSDSATPKSDSSGGIGLGSITQLMGVIGPLMALLGGNKQSPLMRDIGIGMSLISGLSTLFGKGGFLSGLFGGSKDDSNSKDQGTNIKNLTGSMTALNANCADLSNKMSSNVQDLTGDSDATKKNTQAVKDLTDKMKGQQEKGAEAVSSATGADKSSSTALGTPVSPAGAEGEGSLATYKPGTFNAKLTDEYRAAWEAGIPMTSPLHPSAKLGNIASIDTNSLRGQLLSDATNFGKSDSPWAGAGFGAAGQSVSQDFMGVRSMVSPDSVISQNQYLAYQKLWFAQHPSTMSANLFPSDFGPNAKNAFSGVNKQADSPESAQRQVDIANAQARTNPMDIFGGPTPMEGRIGQAGSKSADEAIKANTSAIQQDTTTQQKATDLTSKLTQNTEANTQALSKNSPEQTSTQARSQQCCCGSQDSGGPGSEDPLRSSEQSSSGDQFGAAGEYGVGQDLKANTEALKQSSQIIKQASDAQVRSTQTGADNTVPTRGGRIITAGDANPRLASPPGSGKMVTDIYGLPAREGAAAMEGGVFTDAMGNPWEPDGSEELSQSTSGVGGARSGPGAVRDYGSTGEYGIDQKAVTASGAPINLLGAADGAYGVPGAIMNYGSKGGLGTQSQAAANLVTVTSASGASFKVNAAAAPSFQGFINDLDASGYKIDQSQSGGYVNRNIAGSDTKSEHAFGNAVDINWQANPQGKSGATDLPSNVGDMAARRGLIWGGNWPNNPDRMHFQWGGPGSGGVDAGAQASPDLKANTAALTQSSQVTKQTSDLQTRSSQIESKLGSDNTSNTAATQANTQALQQNSQKQGAGGDKAGGGGGGQGDLGGGDFSGGGADFGGGDFSGADIPAFAEGTAVDSSGGGGMLSGASSAVSGFSSAIKLATSASSLFGSSTNSAASSIMGTVSKVTSLLSSVMGMLGGGGGGGLGGIGSIFSGLSGLGSLFGLAGGTSSTPRGPILVGEKGPEILYQRGGLGVMPAHQTRAFLSGIPQGASGFWAGGITLPSHSSNRMQIAPPSNDNSGSGNANGNSGDTHIHVHAIDSRSGAQFLMAHSDAIAASLNRARRNFNPAA
jgi:hypothetical protein